MITVVIASGPRIWASAGIRKVRVEHDAHRRGAGHHPHGELGIVPDDRAHADHDTVTRGSERVRHPPLRLSADPLRVAGRRGDASVERLRVLEGDERTIAPGADRTEQCQCVGRERCRCRTCGSGRPVGRTWSRRCALVFRYPMLRWCGVVGNGTTALTTVPADRRPSTLRGLLVRSRIERMPSSASTAADSV